MAPGSASPCVNDACENNFTVIHDSKEQTKVVGTFSKEEAFSVALQNQVGLFAALKETMLVQVLQSCPDQSLEWKLIMLQEAMDAFFHDVGLQPLTDYFHATNQQVSDLNSNKRKMPADLKRTSKLAKVNYSYGVESTVVVSSMSGLMYETLPFGRSG